VTDSDLSVLHAALEARHDSCWGRLEDAVDELRELHGIPAEQIVARVAEAATIAEAPQVRDTAFASHV